MRLVERLRMDKATITVASLRDPSGDKGYWLSHSPYERLQAVEIFRQLNYGYDPSTARLLRVLEVAQRASG